MREEEIRVRLWQKQFVTTRSDRVFQKVYEQVRFMVRTPYSYKEYPQEHWETVKMEAVFQGLLEFQPTHQVVQRKIVEVPILNAELKTTKKLVTLPNGKTIEVVSQTRPTKIKLIETARETQMTLLSFLRWKMETAIKTEIRRVVRERESCSLDDTFDDEETPRVDTLLFNHMAEKWRLYPEDPEKAEETLQWIKEEVERRLLVDPKNKKIVRMFRIKLKHPGVTNRAISAKLGIPKTYASAFYSKLRTVLEEVIEDVDII